jgi:hypothetical protein
MAHVSLENAGRTVKNGLKKGIKSPGALFCRCEKESV